MPKECRVSKSIFLYDKEFLHPLVGYLQVFSFSRFCKSYPVEFCINRGRHSCPAAQLILWETTIVKCEQRRPARSKLLLVSSVILWQMGQCYASRSLNIPEKRYSLPARERWFSNCAWGQEVHSLLLGGSSQNCSDHKPHQIFLLASCSIPQLASTWIWCWALKASVHMTIPLSTAQEMR